jgi:hypothetical protein
MASITISCPALNDQAKLTFAVKGTYNLGGLGANGQVRCEIHHPQGLPYIQTAGPLQGAGNWCVLFTNVVPTPPNADASIVASLISLMGQLLATTSLSSFTIKASGTVDCGGSCP